MLTTSCKKNDDNSNPALNGITVTDIDGNVYKTVTIGTQVWMAENLKTTKYRNGDPIPNITDNTAWKKLNSGALCNFNNDANIGDKYGKLYNWYAVDDSRNIAPAGWHVPTDAEWTTLIDYLGGEKVAGGKLKEIGITHWNTPNTGATNETGFTALPGSYRSNDGRFDDIGISGMWWTTDYALFRFMDYDSNAVDSDKELMLGLSVRCVKNSW